MPRKIGTATVTKSKKVRLPKATTGRSKYRAVKTVVDGIAFPSKKQAKRYVELRDMAHAGVIGDLQMEVPYEVKVNGVKVCEYRADFVYRYDKGLTHYTVVEDVKGFRTPVYKLKKRLVEALYGIKIVEV